MSNEPIRLTSRHDGWTANRRLIFLEALAASGSVSHAANAAGMSRQSCYRLRRTPGEETFAESWAAAIIEATRAIVDALVERAIEGEVQPIFYRGDQVGERRRFDNRLAIFLLRTHDAPRYGRQAEVGAFDACDPRRSAERSLAINLAAIEASAE